jgi:formylglycine-generating enzyme
MKTNAWQRLVAVFTGILPFGGSTAFADRNTILFGYAWRQWKQMGRYKTRYSSTALLLALAMLLGQAVETLGAFTVVALPDTQKYSELYPEIFNSQTEWIVANGPGTSRNIMFATHLGDIINGDTNQFANATTAMYKLDTNPNLRWGTCAGNHDGDWADTIPSPPYTQYIAHFGPSHFAGTSWYKGSTNASSYQVFDAEGRTFLVMHLQFDYQPLTHAAGVINWAKSVLSDPQNRNLPTIVTTHGYLHFGTRDPNWGQPWWDEVINPNPQVFMVLCGDDADTEVAFQISTNSGGKQVFEIESDYEKRDNGGNGYLRLMEFDESNGMIQIKTYSPYLDQYLTDAGNQFDLSMNFTERLGPVVAPSCSCTNAAAGITRNPDGTLSLAFLGTPGADYCVVWQTNAAEPITDWALLPNSTNTVTDSSGLWSITVTNEGQSRFYRSKALKVCLPLDEGLVAYYPLDGNANDASGNENNGTPVGLVAAADRFGIAGRAYQLNGSGRIDVPSSSSLNIGGSAITMAGWVYATQFSGTGNRRTIFRKMRQDGSVGGYYFALSNDGYLNFGAKSPSGVEEGHTATHRQLTLSTWAHVAVTYDGAFVIFYVNGFPVDNQACTIAAVGPTDDPLCIGQLSPTYNSECFYGTLDDLRIYKRALSEAEIRELYDGMALIPAGTFMMGNCMSPSEGESNELPLHTVYVSAFYMDKYEVTKALWDTVYQWATNHGYSFDNAGSGKESNHPVQSINWYDVVKWCNARSEMAGSTPCYYTNASLSQMTIYRSGQFGLSNDWVNWVGNGYRLPTEAEWEKAARGGASGRRFPWVDTDNITHSRASYYSSTSYAYDTSVTRGYHPTFNDAVYPYTSPIGYFAANGYGLYDMAGNVYEWCWDWYSSTYYSSSPGTNPRGPASGSHRVSRDGSWYDYAASCRSANRGIDAPGSSLYYLGFRCVRNPTD